MAKESGDEQMLYAEEHKRRHWQWENALRRHNFVGFIGEVLKGVVAQKTREGTYDAWVNDAKTKTEEARRKGGQGDEMEM